MAESTPGTCWEPARQATVPQEGLAAGCSGLAPSLLLFLALGFETLLQMEEPNPAMSPPPVSPSSSQPHRPPCPSPGGRGRQSPEFCHTESRLLRVLVTATHRRPFGDALRLSRTSRPRMLTPPAPASQGCRELQSDLRERLAASPLVISETPWNSPGVINLSLGRTYHFKSPESNQQQ